MCIFSIYKVLLHTLTLQERFEDMYKIAVVPGDGTGPEVVREGLKALAAVARKKNFTFELINYDLGGERYMKTGDLLPESIIASFGSAALFISVP